MRFLAVLLVVALLAGGAGWAALEADAAPSSASPSELRLTTPVLSARRTPEALLDTRRDQSVAAAVATIPARIPGASCLVVAEAGRPLVEHQPDQPLTPASTQKLLVGAAVLTLLGPDATFRTTAVTATPSSGGVVEGDLFIVGGGDPLLATDAYIARQADPAKPATRIEDLADAIVAAGVQQITGSVVGDGTRYDDVRDIPSWPQRYRDQVAAGPLSGLGVNDGLETFTETEVPVNPGRPAADPPAHTAEVLSELLEARGVAIAGPARSGAAPDGAIEVAAIESPPVHTVVAQMLRYSDNTTAELLVKEIGVLTASEGSTPAGLAGLASTLAGEGVAVDGVALTDGSGLDLGNRATCRSLAQVLTLPDVHEPLVEGLAVAGESGTLAGRMQGTAAAGNLRAKTGSLRNVAALAGVVDGADGRTYAFAYITNLPEGEFVPDSEAALQEELAVALASVAPTEPPPEILPTPASASGG